MVLARSARKHLQHARKNFGKDDATKSQTCVLICMGMWCAAKLVALQVRLILDMDNAAPAWHSHVANLTSAKCAKCLQLGFSRQVEGHSSLELTDCFYKFGHEIMVKRPYDATSGGEMETWRDSWEMYGGDWWGLYPLAESPTRFDDRWVFPDWHHQSLVSAGSWWPDYCVMALLAIIAVVVLVLFLSGLPAAHSGLPVTGMTFATFCPYFAYRLAQNFGWDHTPEGCALVHFRIDEFASTGFWMFAFFYMSVAYAVVPILNIRKDADNNTENCASRLFEVFLSTACFSFGLLFLQSIRTRVKSDHVDMLELWMFGLVCAAVDVFVLWPLMALLVWCGKADDRIIMFTADDK